jgi:hypothetical protein
MNVTNVIFSFFFDIFCPNSFLNGFLLLKLPDFPVSAAELTNSEEYMIAPLLILHLEL